MNSQTVGPHPGRQWALSDVHRAWWCVVSVPAALVLAFVAGEGLSALLGYTTEGVPPWWVGGTALLGATAVLAVPTGLAVWFDRRARREGDHRGRVPATVMLVLLAVFVGVNLFSWAMRVLLGG